MRNIQVTTILSEQYGQRFWSKCFRAMVLEDSEHWYAEEGRLSYTICEQTEADRASDPEECCACDEAKYKVSLSYAAKLQSNFREPY